MLQETRLTVDADIPEHPVWIWGEQEALERIFSNLYQNAGRYAESFLRISVNEKKNRRKFILRMIQIELRRKRQSIFLNVFSCLIILKNRGAQGWD